MSGFLSRGAPLDGFSPSHCSDGVLLQVVCFADLFPVTLVVGVNGEGNVVGDNAVRSRLEGDVGA